MRNIRKNPKAFMISCLLIVVLGVSAFALGKPFTASAEPNLDDTRAVYDGYRHETSENWYNDSLPVSATPMITVLTHGLGGDASHWSNNHDGFAYDNGRGDGGIDHTYLEWSTPPSP